MKQDKDTPKTLVERIELCLTKLGKTERGASLEAGLSESFLRNIRRNKSSSPRIDTLEKIAHILDTDVHWLMTGHSPKHTAAHRLKAQVKEDTSPHNQENLHDNKAEIKNSATVLTSNCDAIDNFSPSLDNSLETPNAKIGQNFMLSKRHLPVYGQAVGGIDGEFPMNGSTLYNVLCPPQLSEVSGAYAVAISGDSMYPRYEDGEIAFVDPTRLVRKGDYVIAQILADIDQAPYAYVKKFIRHNAGGLVLEQFNPAKELYFPHERVVSVHYIALAGTAPS